MSDSNSATEAYLLEYTTIGDVERIVAESETLLEVQRALRIPRSHARPFVFALGLEEELPGSAFLKTEKVSDG